ncbi:hypothetical protein DFH09DRAFT_1271940 [Mycena vulgaris]|nr:hypothetical protein DFH09DRAFT_1271940 [Mycena vulgaris]
MELLDACSGTLKHLTFELPADPVKLPALPAPSSPVVLVNIVSKTIASLPHLEVLTIGLLDRANTLRQWRFEWEKGWAREWADLDSTFVDASVHEVRFALRQFLPPDAERTAGLAAFLQERLPRISASNGPLRAGLISTGPFNSTLFKGQRVFSFYRSNLRNLRGKVVAQKYVAHLPSSPPGSFGCVQENNRRSSQGLPQRVNWAHELVKATEKGAHMDALTWFDSQGTRATMWIRPAGKWLD